MAKAATAESRGEVDEAEALMAELMLDMVSAGDGGANGGRGKARAAFDKYDSDGNGTLNERLYVVITST